MKVLVLGCGPAGLMAVHSASVLKNDVICVSRARKSQMYGAQYLHSPIPLATPTADLSGFSVSYELRGSVSAYREKVYGRNYSGTVSPEDLTESHDGWDIRSTYDSLWEMYGDYVHDEEDIASAPGLVDRILEWAKPDVTISTVPAPAICRDPSHLFRSQHIYSTGQDSRFAQDFTMPDNTVICNGEDSPSWYRAARIQGHTTIEWPEGRKPPIDGLHHVEKPISTTCTCYSSIVRMGRYGRWQKGVLSDSAFHETYNLLTQPQQMRLSLEDFR